MSSQNWTVDQLANCIILRFVAYDYKYLSATYNVYLLANDGTRVTLTSGSFTNEKGHSFNAGYEFLILCQLNSFSTIAPKIYTPVVEFSNVRPSGPSNISSDEVYFFAALLMRGSGTQFSDYAESSIGFTSTTSVDIVQIGKNGLQISHKSGGFVQMLNDDTDLYVRMFGLPEQPSTLTDEGQLYLDRANGLIKAKVNSN